MLKIDDSAVVGIGRSAEVSLLMACLHLQVVESCTGEEAAEMLQMLVWIFHEELLAGDVVEQLELMVENTGQVAAKIDSYIEVVDTGEEVGSCSDEEPLVMMVELVTCMEVVDTGLRLVGIHSRLEVTNNDVVVAECCSSMVVVKTSGSVLDISILAEVEGSCKIVVEMSSCLKALTDEGKVVARGSSFGEVVGTDELDVETG
jgi:hypothetical protein